MDSLKIFLNSAAGQHIQRVYLNNKMEWLFAPRPGFEKILSREEVLAYKQTSLQTPGEVNKTVLKGIVQTKATSSSNNTCKPKHSNRF